MSSSNTVPVVRLKIPGARVAAEWEKGGNGWILSKSGQEREQVGR